MFESIFGPLDVKYCYLFLAFSLLGLIMVVMTGVELIQAFRLRASNKEKMNLLWRIMIGVVYYIQNRLLYSMCQRTMV
jgi:hypothetical protein